MRRICNQAHRQQISRQGTKTDPKHLDHKKSASIKPSQLTSSTGIPLPKHERARFREGDARVKKKKKATTASWKRRRKKLPQILIGASSSNKLGCCKKISLEAAQSWRISDSDNCTCFPGRPRTSRRRLIMSSRSVWSICSTSRRSTKSTSLFDANTMVSDMRRVEAVSE